MVKQPATKPVYQFMVKAATNEGFSRVLYVNDYALGEAWMHVMARGLRNANEGKKNISIVITMFDMTNTKEANILAQYNKNADGEQFKVFRPDTLMLLPEARKEIYHG